MRKEFVHRKKLELYQSHYEKVRDGRTRLYGSVGCEEPYESKECALNFLFALNIFRKIAPKRVIRKRFEDFRDAKDLAKEILKEGL